METNYLENNYLALVGKVTSDKVFSHEIYGEKFYVFDLSVPRLSGSADVVPVTISERLLTKDTLNLNRNLRIEGQFRSYNSYEGERSRLVLTVFAKEVEELEDGDIQPSKDLITNEVTLQGFVCKPPIYRKTPFGREIADLLMAVNRAYGKSDYIPIIAWGRNARYCENLPVGSEIKIVGRIQSRKYEKKYEDGTVATKVAYEVSAGSLAIINRKDEVETAETEETAETTEAQSEENEQVM